MSKFKVGDRVISLAESAKYYHQYELGVLTFAPVSGVMWSCRFESNYRNSDWAISEPRMELEQIFNSPLYKALL